MNGNYPEPEFFPDEGYDPEDEYVYAWDVLDGKELADQLASGRTRIRYVV